MQKPNRTLLVKYKDRSNYELSTLLKIPESKIKTLRLNSALKYQKIDSKAILVKIVNRLINSEEFIHFESGKVEISLEDPIEKRELENFLKKEGHYAEYTLNSEVLRILPFRLFELICDNLDNADEAFNTLVQSNIREENIERGLMDQGLSLRQKLGRLKNEALNGDTMRALLSGAVSLLSG